MDGFRKIFSPSPKISKKSKFLTFPQNNELKCATAV